MLFCLCQSNKSHIANIFNVSILLVKKLEWQIIFLPKQACSHLLHSQCIVIVNCQIIGWPFLNTFHAIQCNFVYISDPQYLQITTFNGMFSVVGYGICLILTRAYVQALQILSVFFTLVLV